MIKKVTLPSKDNKINQHNKIRKRFYKLQSRRINNYYYTLRFLRELSSKLNAQLNKFKKNGHFKIPSEIPNYSIQTEWKFLKFLNLIFNNLIIAMDI